MISQNTTKSNDSYFLNGRGMLNRSWEMERNYMITDTKLRIANLLKTRLQGEIPLPEIHSHLPHQTESYLSFSLIFSTLISLKQQQNKMNGS